MTLLMRKLELLSSKRKKKISSSTKVLFTPLTIHVMTSQGGDVRIEHFVVLYFLIQKIFL